MRKHIKIFVVLIILFTITTVVSIGVFNLQKETSIDTILASENYSYLPVEAKNYVKEIYEETGVLIHTEKNKEENMPYLNPEYASYLSFSESEKEEVDLVPVPYLIDYVDREESNEGLPTSFDLRNVNGKSYITPLKNQGSLGLCWGFATVEQAESYLMLTNNKPYDSTTKTFSVRQIDYGTSYHGIIDYENENGYRDLVSGGNFYMSSLFLANGLSLINDSLMPYDFKEDKKELSDVLSYQNSQYELDSSIIMPELTVTSGTEYENYISTVNNAIYNYGGAYAGTGSPTGSCGSKNVDGKYIIVDNSSCKGNINYNGHAMQIIGWDDNYEYSYCQSGTTHVDVNSRGTCDKGTLKTGKGAWLIRNSWGDDTPYVYLAYESIHANIGVITSLSKDNSWDNNYHKNAYADGIAPIKSDTITFSKKINTPEKVEKIKFMAASTSGNYTVSITSGNYSYKNIKTIRIENPGIYTIDLSDKNILLNSNNFQVTISSTNNAYLMTNTMSIFTSNIEKESIIGIEDFEVTANDMRLYSETKNIPSGSKITYKLYNSKNSDVSSYLTVKNNVVAENNINTLVTFSDNLESGTYRLDTIYDSKVLKSVNVKVEKMKGNGTKNNPYVITTPYQLAKISEDLDAYYVLGNDIDLEETTKSGGDLSAPSETCSGGYGWKSINGFSGSLDGKGHTIRGLRQENYLTCTVNGREWYSLSNNGNGLFGKTTGNVTIKNLVLEDFDITCQGGRCGLLVSDYTNESSDTTEYTANFENIAVRNSKVKGVNSKNSTYGGGLFGYIQSFNGNVNISNIYIDIDIDTSEIRDTAYLASSLYSKKSVVQNIQLNGELNGKYSDGSGDHLLIDTVYGNVTIKNILSTVFATNISSNLLGHILTDNLTISNVNMLKVSDRDMCYSGNGDFCKYINNVKIYDKDTGLSELVKASNYASWDNFDSNWVIKTVSGVPRIPVLSFANFEYTTIPNIVLNQELNKKVSLFDYLTPKSKSAKRITYKSNDESIVKIDSTGTIIPQKTGSTTIHIESFYDGYIYDLPINVTYIPHYNIAFDANGGNGTMNSVEVRVGENYLLPKNTFTKENYVFKEWNTKVDGTGTSYSNLGKVNAMNDKETITLYAQWIGEDRTITFNANGGTVTPSKKVVHYGETYGELPIPSREGYAFNYWVFGNILVDAMDIVTGNITLKASWKQNAYTIIYDANDGTLMEDYPMGINIMSKTIVTDVGNNGSSEKLLQNVYVKKGYKFKEWNTKKDGTGTSYQENQEIILDNVENSTLRLYSIWELNSGTITYHANDGTNSKITQEFEFDVDTKLNKNTFVREDYEFKEWNTASDGTGTSYQNEQVVNISSNMNLYAIWIPALVNNTKDYEGYYDGEEHSLTIDINFENYEIRYSLDGENYDLQELPTFKEIGEYTIYYKIIVSGIEMGTGSNKVKIYGMTVSNIVLKDNILLVKNNLFSEVQKEIMIYANASLFNHYNKDKVIVESDILKTGDIIQINLDNVKNYEYFISVLGDVNSDGKISSADYVKLRKHIMQTELIKDNLYFYAADVNGDNKISSADYVKIRKYIMNGEDL